MPDHTINLREEVKKLQGPIVVLGAGGFVGANLLRTILADRDDCFGVTHQQYVPWRLVDLPVERILYADLTLPKSVEHLFTSFSFRTIFDFAAYGAYARQDDVHRIYETNILGLADLLEIATARGFSAYVHAGSSSEYGINAAAPRENDTLMPNSHYAVSKVAASYLVRYQGVLRKLPVINLRYYSIYGPFEEPDRLIPTLVEHGLRRTYPVLVDPDISRDFVYIDDAIGAAILAATRGVIHARGASLNIATGKKTTIRDLVGVMRKLCVIEEKPRWGTMENRRWDLKEWYGDPRLAKKLLGWRPRTSLEEGLRRTIAWQRERVALPASIHPLHNRAIRLSAVIACYRDAQAIPIMYRRLVEAFRSINVDYEIIFVNDASPDNSDEMLADITSRDNHVVAIEHSRNFGSQSAFLSGMQVSTGDGVILFDGDLQDPPELIPKFFEEWRKGNDVVFGKRVKRETNSMMQFFYKAFYKVFREVSYVPIPLDAGDFSLMDRKVVDQLLALPETDQFLRGLRAWVGFKQTGVDYVRPERMFGRTTNSLMRNIWWAKKGIFSFSFVPLELMSYLGMALTVLSFLALIGQVIAKMLYPDIPHGITTIIVLILFFGGIQILAISILGEYLMKIFEETKKRPKFIRKSIRHGGRQFTTADEMESFLKSQARH
jgi:nucleoside-diphosphate-sugar epimerase/glycosyltransferase involved in cell wall biosynthesis